VILGLYAFLIGICLSLILVGLFRENESGFALIGFGLLFILSFVLINGELEIEKGANITTSFSYDVDGSISDSTQDIDYSYNKWDDSTAHQIGFWIAILAAFGFIGMLFAIKGGKKSE